MMHAAKTLGQVTTPGQQEVDDYGVGKTGSMAERFKNVNFLSGFYKSKEKYEKYTQENRLGSQPPSSNFVGYTPVNPGFSNQGGLNFKG